LPKPREAPVMTTFFTEAWVAAEFVKLVISVICLFNLQITKRYTFNHGPLSVSLL
jgi:hypothetical protein